MLASMIASLPMARARVQTAALRPSIAAFGLALVAGLGLSLASCGTGNPGIDPPDASLGFPAGLLLDPRVSTEAGEACVSDEECGGGLCTSGGVCRDTAQWLFVTNANSDRRYNAGSILAIDLDGFFEALADEDSILGASESVSENEPCRRIPNLPQAIECLEEPFVATEVTTRFGNFPGPVSAWLPEGAGDDEATLLIPVRGDPSVTYIELSGGLDGGAPTLDCGQANNESDSRRCGDEHRLRFLRNDSESARLAREPFRVLVSPGPGRPLAYVSHQGDPDLTLISLDGLSTLTDVLGDGSFVHEYVGRPAIVDQSNDLVLTGAPINLQGGFGLAQRPCDPEAEFVPNSTLGCTRPLIYTGMRWTAQVRTFTAIENEPLPGQVCENPGVDPAEIGATGQIICEPQVQGLSGFDAGGLSTAGVPVSTGRPILADIGFSRTGDELYVVQSNPGGLLRIDTSVNDSGEVLDVATGQVEVCSQPTSLVIYDDGQVEYGLVTCYRSGEVYIVDLAQLTVVGISRAGIGPNAMTVDLGREVVYVGNSLDATVSVIDMNPQNAARFTQIARIGIQEPYVQ